MTTPDNTVRDHREQAWEFLGKSREYLAQDDLHQASEKGWGAAAHMVKAVAETQGWDYRRHDQFHTVVYQAMAVTSNNQLRRLGNAANTLHSNYYQRKFLLDAGAIGQDIDDVEELLNALQPLTDGGYV